MAPGSSLTRRGFGGLLGAAAGTGALSPTWASANADQESEHRPSDRGRPPRRPNLLVILGDDLGWADLSSYGAPDIQHPEPRQARALRHPLHPGLLGLGRLLTDPLQAVHRPLPGPYSGRARRADRAPNEIGGIPLDHPTLATLLKERGYDTAMFGKWHCGYLPWLQPHPVWAGTSSSATSVAALDYFSKLNHNGDHDLYEGEVEVKDLRYYTRDPHRAGGRVRPPRHDKPWLLNLNFTTPHWPWEGRRATGPSATSSTARIKAGEQQVLFHYDGGSRREVQARWWRTWTGRSARSSRRSSAPGRRRTP